MEDTKEQELIAEQFWKLLLKVRTKGIEDRYTAYIVTGICGAILSHYMGVEALKRVQQEILDNEISKAQAPKASLN